MDKGKNREDYSKQQRASKKRSRKKSTGCIPAPSQDLPETCLGSGFTSRIRGGLGKGGTLEVPEGKCDVMGRRIVLKKKDYYGEHPLYIRAHCGSHFVLV